MFFHCIYMADRGRLWIRYVGAKTAHSLLSSSPEDSRPSLVILEARETCSGASGRNAGHCRPDAFRGFTAFSKIHGKDEAAGVLVSESITLDR